MSRTLPLGRVGESVKRVDGIPKTTGEFAYSSDLYAAGMLWGHTLRSPHAHARIVEIDLSEALTSPGVHAVLTHDGRPRTEALRPRVPRPAGARVREGALLRRARRARRGRAPRAGAAEPRSGSRVEYEPLEPVVDMERAMEQEPIHDQRWTHGHGYLDDPRSNVVRHLVIRHGDPDTSGDVSVSGVYELGIQDQAFLGPESGLAIPDGEGGVDIYVATQWLHVDRDQIAPCLGLEPERVRIHLAGVGGAFGGREDLSMQIHSALLALHTSRPVKMVYNREESFVGHVHRHPAKIWAEHRADRDGKLVCVRMRILLDGGAYASSSTAVTSNAAAFACGPYAVANALLESTCVYSNNPPCGAMRGFGAVQTCFAAEAQMDKLADALGLDPVELRLRNALAPGDELPTGQKLEGSLPVAEVIRRAAELPIPEAGAAAEGGDRAARRRGQHDARRGRAPRRRLRGRVQEHLLLGGLRRLLRGARAAACRRQRRGALRSRGGRAGRDERDPAGRADRARHGRRHARPAHDRHRRLGRLDVGVAHDVDGRGRGAARVPRRGRGARA